MRIASFAVIAAALLAASADAQTVPAKQVFALPPESVTVIATRPSEETIRAFVETRGARTYVLDRMARWTSKVCPLTIGLGDKYARYITQRIRDVAAAVGAPVDQDPGCRPNIEVVFTTAPQTLMTNIRNQKPIFLGFFHNGRQADDLANVAHSIQGWYTTVSQDIDGNRQIDTGTCGVGTSIGLQQPVGGGEGMTAGTTTSTLTLPCAVVVHSSGFRASDGLDSGLYNVLIVAEPAKLLDFEVGSLADYVTLLALSQPASLDNCQELPSITNMLAKDCASVPNRITDGDLAFLQALYKIPNGEKLATQRGHIEYEMKKILVTDKAN
ncbi:MAG TPA: hypothetical protein VHZ32_03115 [Rhizomicrobium sp.]|nr:hypothetical protein [Rhizomicrobium sp.]